MAEFLNNIFLFLLILLILLSLASIVYRIIKKKSDNPPENPAKIIYRQKIIISDKEAEIKELREELNRLNEEKKLKSLVSAPRPEYIWEERDGCYYLIYNALLPKRIHPRVWGEPKDKVEKGETFNIQYRDGSFTGSVSGLTAPVTGTLFVLLYGKDGIRASDEVAMIDPNPDAADELVRYMENVRERERMDDEEKDRRQKEWERQMAESEKKEMARKIKEKYRKRQLEKIVRQELIDSGELFGDQPKRPPIPREVVDAVYRRDGGRCVYCGSTKDLQIDHIIPFSRGGSSELENLQLLCRKCNIEKSNKIG